MEQKKVSRQVKRALQREYMTMDKVESLKVEVMRDCVTQLTSALKMSTAGMGDRINETLERMQALAFLLHRKDIISGIELSSAVDTFRSAYTRYEEIMKTEAEAVSLVETIITEKLPFDQNIIDKIKKSGYDKDTKETLVVRLGLTKEVLNEQTPEKATETAKKEGESSSS